MVSCYKSLVENPVRQPGESTISNPSNTNKKKNGTYRFSYKLHSPFQFQSDKKGFSLVAWLWEVQFLQV